MCGGRVSVMGEAWADEEPHRGARWGPRALPSATGDGPGSRGVEGLEPGLIIDDRYEVRRQLGRGGMSAIYEAEHRYTTRRLALKVLNATNASHSVARRLLLDEARAFGAVRRPCVIEVHDAGFDGSRVYVVTEHTGMENPPAG